MEPAQKRRLTEILDRMAGQTVVVLGDLVADESVYAERARLSREVAFGLIPKRRASEIRPGGGANFVLALTAGASYLEAPHLANIAGECVVMKRGTATVTREELCQAIASA